MLSTSKLMYLLFFVSFGEFLQAGTPQAVQRELVLREVLLPQVNSTFDRSWERAFPLGDANRDGRSDFFVFSGMKNSIHPFQTVAPGFFSLGGTLVKRGPDGLAGKRIRYDSGWTNIYTTCLRTPNGIQMVTGDAFFPGTCSAWDVQTGQFVQNYPVPSPPSGKPPMSGYNHVQWAGDVNGDGFDDFFAQSSTNANPVWAVTALIDGDTGQTLWQHYLVGFGTYSPVLHPEAREPVDMNGDGIPDVLSGFLVTSFLQKKHSIIALSGADGSVIWQNLQPLYQGYPRYSVSGRDLNGDGIPDVVSLDSPRGNYQGNVVAIDGSDGTEIWSVDGDFLLADLPSASVFGLNYPVLMTDRPGSPGDVDIVVTAAWGSPGALVHSTTYGILDGATGDYIDKLDPPEFLLPWLPDPSKDPLLEIRKYPMGDIDGDGFQEIAHSIPVPAYQTPGSTFVPRVLAILGQRTLYMPKSTTPGSSITAEIDLPSLPGHPVHLILSSRFNPRPTDWTIQDWHTSMAITPLLQSSLHRSALTGVTDANGNAKITVQVPNRPEFIGTNFYSRAIVLKPASGEVQTLTTMETTAIL